MRRELKSRVSVASGLIACLFAALALGCLSAGSAAAADLTLSEGGKALAPRAIVYLFGYGNLEVDTSLGSLDCSYLDQSTGLEFAVTSNSAKKDGLLLEELYGNDLEPCHSFTGNAYAFLEFSGPLTLGADGRARTGAPLLRVGFERFHEEEVFCSYATHKLSGTNDATAARQHLTVSLASKMHLVDHSPGRCPRTAQVTLSLPSTEGENGLAIEEEV